jgi:hypothetical protein
MSVSLLHVYVPAACLRPCCMYMSVLRDLKMQLRHGHAAWTRMCSMDIHAAWLWTCSRDVNMQQKSEHAAGTQTYSKDMGMQLGHGHAAQTWKFSMDMGMQQGCGHAAWARTCIMNMDMNIDKQNVLVHDACLCPLQVFVNAVCSSPVHLCTYVYFRSECPCLC